MPIWRLPLWLSGTIIAVPLAVSVSAATPLPSQVEGVLQCRTIAAAADRLACFDKATETLRAATESREVVVLDRAEVKRTRKSLFGFTLPRIALFGSAEPAEGKLKAPEPDEIDEIEAVIRRTVGQAYGRYTITLEEGGTWRTTEPWQGTADPEPGSKVTIKHGALSRYTIKVRPGGRAVGIERVN